MNTQRISRSGFVFFMMIVVARVSLADEPVSPPPVHSATVGVGDTAGVPGTCGVYGPDHCQLDNGSYLAVADRSLYGGSGIAVADDFIAQGSTISTICWWPAFLDLDPVSGFWGPCADLARDGVGPPPDNWIIRFFDDNGVVPGQVLHELYLQEGDITLKAWQGGNSNVWDYSVVLDPPLTNFVPGQRYWIEIGGYGNSQCSVLLQQSEDGNGYFLRERGAGFSLWDSLTWTDADVSMDQNDIAFCLDMSTTPSIAVPPVVTGACCSCDGVCQDGVSREDCLGYDCMRDGSSAAPSCEPLCTGSSIPCPVAPLYTDATFSPGELCADVACDPAGGEAPPLPGDSCTDPVELTGDGDYPYNNNCATTDWPSPFGDSGEIPSNSGRRGNFVKDIWFTYHASATASVDISICHDRNYDGMLAVYTNGTPECPTDCSPEALEPLLFGGKYLDRECPAPWWEMLDFCALPDTCYLIRVGGFEDRMPKADPVLVERDRAGEGVLSVTTIHIDPAPIFAPVPELGAMSGGAPSAEWKNRFLSFSFPEQYNRFHAIRVTFVDLPPPYDVWNGQALWVGPPRLISELPGNDDDTAPNFTAAPLQCERHIDDWSQVGTIHVYHEGVVPGGRYDVQVTGDYYQDDCPDYYFSLPAEMSTSVAGDVVGAFMVPGGPWTVPDDSVDVATDVIAVLDKFGNAPTAPSKTRVDLEPALLDFKINITDAVVVLDAFAGAGYPFAPSSPDPCSSE